MTNAQRLNRARYRLGGTRRMLDTFHTLPAYKKTAEGDTLAVAIAGLHDAVEHIVHVVTEIAEALAVPQCRVCGCTDDDCSGCIERTGEPCYWAEPDLCSACVGVTPDVAITLHAPGAESVDYTLVTLPVHTPGPWLADGAVRVQGAAPDYMHDIARIVPTPAHYVDQHAEANARLIAAAPDLLAACEALLGRLEVTCEEINRLDPGMGHPDGVSQMVMDDARAAVAAARGTSGAAL